MRIKELIERLNTGIGLQLNESILVPEVDMAFKDWVNNVQGDWMLIGGIVVGYYSKPRTTMDVDVIFQNRSSIPEKVNGFKRTRSLAFQHNKTHVEIEVLCPENINLDESLYDQIYNTSVIENGIRIPSPAGMICLKLSRGSMQDLADIEAILVKHPSTTIKGFLVDPDKVTSAENKLGRKIR